MLEFVGTQFVLLPSQIGTWYWGREQAFNTCSLLNYKRRLVIRLASSAAAFLGVFNNHFVANAKLAIRGIEKFQMLPGLSFVGENLDLLWVLEWT